MRNVHILLMLIVVASAVVLYEIEYLSGGISAVVTIAAASSALLFSMAHKPEAVMASEGQETVEVEGFGLKGRAQGKRLLTNNSVLLIVSCLLLFAVYKHHTDNEAALTRLFEAMAENTYVLSLPQAEREKLNIRMPDSLRRKLRTAE